MASLTKLVARLSPELRNALESGVGEAIKRKAAAVETAHWLFHIIFGSDSDLQAFLEGQGVQMSDLQAELERAMPMGAGEGGKQPTISGSVTKLIEQAWLLASVELNLGQITPEVFLLATQQPNALGVRAEALAALKPMSTDALQAFCTERGKSVPAAASGGAAAAAPVDGTALEKYTVNLTELARKGELDTVLGRTNEVAKAIDVLLRKRQNNPILLGAPGVGKTAVVEGLAQKIAAGEVPDQLKGADLVSLDMGLLQAGASVKGEFEERLKNVIKEVQASDTPIIVFIDEAHTMIGAGGTEGQNDAANLLKPALARGEFRTVAATTFAEYKKYFEKDPALSRRFQPITIDEPGRDAAVNILRAVSEGLSKHHDVFVREEAIKAAVDLSIRFMPSRRLPDKAISLMDTACARVALSQHARPAQIEGLEEELRFVEAELEKSTSDARMFGDPEFDASTLNEDIDNLKTTLADRISMWEDQKEKVSLRLEAARTALEAGEQAEVAAEEDEDIIVHPWVTGATVAEVVADWTGVPIANLGASEAERLLALEDTLKQRVIGQDAAIESIAKSLKISRAGLTDTRKPIGVFMMCGPSGVGKTETALAIADQFFGGEDAVTTINMTEFKEAHKVSMLLGAAAGYVGYGKGGVLTEAVRRRPYSVLLLDEMEKAHREIQDVFFQIFDKGHISDSEGNDVDFRNTIIIMTSNAGGEEIRDFVDAAGRDPSPEELNDHLRPLLLDHFSPAFIGRTELIAYRPLTPEVGAKLTEIHLNRIKKRIKAQYGASFNWEASFVDYVVSANSDPLSGGRALEAIINKNFLPRLAEECINRVIEDKPLEAITVSHDGADVVLKME
ncbi:Chaperone protein ClpB [Tritonibacter multivorans]|uniref:Chaperone protein ClpB n=1 Tax=Tritonibacter multivorans TaxID=928856 RepID=A0A0P1GAD8_9RHOB|nr:type VI secretion system ATPase TssH [Tritonibacter multivorans]MDA7422148.1 type VI secretion system ATPase TssH [Tritonibacter multivorans]CUH78370.1 Chaperone protein ClpB [Tritonibacter multivorans]SFD15923.1 type VI secretion system protein VasG [Tritonibacter multivorans]